MLMSLGVTTFEIAPVNIHAHSRDASADFAEKPVLGARPPLEFMGEGGEARSLTGRLFPRHFGGSLNDLDAMRKAGQAMPLTMGNGQALGWFVIDKLTEKSSFLQTDGTGGMIEFDISLRRADGPAAIDYFSLLSSLFV